MKGNTSLSALVFNRKVKNRLILYLQGRFCTRNLSSKIVKLKESCTEQNLKAIQFNVHPDILYSRCHFLKEVVDYLTKRINSVKEKC